MAQSHINMTINGNITQEPTTKKINNVDAIVFSVAVSTGERDTSSKEENAFITNFYEVTYFPSPKDSFMQKAQRGTEVTLNGKGWMYSYYSEKDKCTKSGLKFRAHSYFLGARQKDAAAPAKPVSRTVKAKANAEDEYVDI